MNKVGLFFIVITLLIFNKSTAQDSTFILIQPQSDTVKNSAFPMLLAATKITAKKAVLQFGKDYFFANGYKQLIVVNAKQYDTLIVTTRFIQNQLFLPSTPKYSWIQRTENPQSSLIKTTQNQENELITDGVLVRGISFGNIQDLVTNSNLNMRIGGRIGKEIEIEGAISDQLFPFQPDGTTATLQDFDRIYTQIKYKKNKFLFGDFGVENYSGARFLKYSKKNRGFLFAADFGNKTTHGKLQFNAAISRGRFARNEIQGAEGLQGPYRLTGARNEQFIVVISGTEKVFLDGKLMVRGLQGDYTMDYNLGEITFTPKIFINANSRIVVEFQYTDRIYARTVANLESEIQLNKRVAIYGGIYSEQDSKNSDPLQINLDFFDSIKQKTARQILENSGDTQSAATINDYRLQTEFSSAIPNYFIKDSSGRKIFVYANSIDANKKYYRVSFTFVGQGNGDYKIAEGNANGKIFTFIERLNGLPQGDYSPFSILPAPTRLSVTELGMQWKVHPGGNFRIQVAGSSLDKNLFSTIDDKDNLGGATAVQYDVNHKFKKFRKDSGSKLFLQYQFLGELTTANFSSIERYRDVEFNRQFERQLQNPSAITNRNETRFMTQTAKFGLENKAYWQAKMGWQDKSDTRSYFWNTGFFYRLGNWSFEPSFEKANSEGMNFEKWMQDVKWVMQHHTFTLNGVSEKNIRNENPLLSYQFNQGEALYQYQGKKSNHELKYTIRESFQQLNRKFFSANVAQNINYQNKLNFRNASVISSLNYRNSNTLRDTFLNLFANEENIAGRLELSFFKWLKWFQGNIFFQSMSGREQQRQFSFFEVLPGQGQFAWIDFNKNNIQETNEFEETPFKDQAKFIRILVPTGRYINAQTSEYNANISGKKTVRFKKSGEYIFTNRNSINYLGKVIKSTVIEKVIPFLVGVENENLLSYQFFTRNVFDISRADQTLSIQYQWQQRSNKFFLTNGFDRRQQSSHQAFARWNSNAQWQWKGALEWKTSQLISEFNAQNNYQYQSVSAEPTVTWQANYKNKLSLSGKFSALQWVDSISLGNTTETNLGYTRSIGVGGILEMRLIWIWVDLNANSNTPLGFDVLQGFGNGNNFRWNLDFRTNVSKNIQLLLNYEGRKSQQTNIVHIARVEARYLF